MATVTHQVGHDNWILIETNWAGYQSMLRIRGERCVPRVTYLDGRMTLVSPGFSHEFLRKRLGTFIEEVLDGLGIRYLPAGHTTLRRRARRGGVEGDESFYVANAAKIAGKKRLYMSVDPPPDLAIEVVFSHLAEYALEVYRRLGVPEVWVCDAQNLQILLLQGDQTYVLSRQSAVLPRVSAEEAHDWVARPDTGAMTDWKLEVRRWVTEILAPRLATPPEDPTQ
jgi:Uma2 family endonuclease